MSIPYNIIELFSKYFLDKSYGQSQLSKVLPLIKKGNSIHIMWNLYQTFKENLNELDICKLYEVIGPEIELKYDGSNRCCALIWNLEEDGGICFPSRCKKDKFTNYNFCRNHYPPIPEDSTSTIINYKWKLHGSIFDLNIQPCFFKFKKSLYEKNKITLDSSLESYNYYQFNIISHLKKDGTKLHMINNLLPILTDQLDLSNSIKYNEIEQTCEKPIEYPIINDLLPISIQKTDDFKITNCDLSSKNAISHKEVNTKIKHLKKVPLTNNMKKLYYTTLLVSAMVSKEIKIDKNNIENIKIYDDPIIYLKDKQFIFKGTKPVGIILDCDTAYMLKDIIEELNNHSIDTSLKDVFIESLK
jgi:hypothetical protein